MKNIYQIVLVSFSMFLFCNNSKQEFPEWGNWHRPVENPVFTTAHQNNHDPIIFVDTTLKYPYHLIVGGWGCRHSDVENTYLWRSKSFSWSSESWELVSDNYEIGCFHEYDDGIKIGDKYYIFKKGNVYTFEGNLEDASGKWKIEGSFPKELCRDVGVFYEDGIFHLFGEFGEFPHGFDGTSLSHITSKTGLGDWKLHDTKAVDPNPGTEKIWGVGDPTIIKIEDEYYLYCDIESKEIPYRIIAWKSKSLYDKFEQLGVAMSPREDAIEHWDNYNVQDGDIAFIPEISKYVMVCNMKDLDGVPGGDFPRLKPNVAKVVGFFYSNDGLERK